MNVSVVIPAYNEEKLLPATLQSVFCAGAALAERGWKWEVIVCDNNSTDRTAEMARAGGAKVVFEPVNQIGRARNRGASAAVGEWLVFVDADSHPSRELFADMASTIAGGKCLAGGSTVRMDQRDWFADALAGAWNLISRVKKWGAGSFIFCEAAVFRELGGFHHELYATEELELFERLHKRAKTTGRQIVILHRHPLVTSARKVHLYSKAEHLRFFWSSIASFGKVFRSRAECHTWYDGRR